MTTESSDPAIGSVVLRRELIAAGYTDNQIRARVQAGDLARVRRGAYYDGAGWDSLDAVGRHRVLCRAVLRTAHPDTVLTHVSAAVEHGFPVWGADLSVAHTTRTDGRSGRHEADWVQHRGRLPDEHVKVINGIKVSTPVRCAIEITTVADVEQSLVTVNAMLHAGAMTPHALDELARDIRYWPQSLTADLVVRRCDARLESVGETRFDQLCFLTGLPRPTPQVVVKDESGRVVARLDFVWEKHGVFVEFDGRAKYRQHRREGESLEDYLMREKRREEKVCLLTGWVCLRITWADLEQPERTASRIRAILDSRAPQGA